MKRILMTLFSLLISNLVLMAQAPKGMGKNDANAKKILDAVSVKFKSFKTFQASFVLKIENATGKSLGNKTGTVYMKGNRYKINVSGQ
jgi:outer membrane lipoprotein-sorting protein